MIRRIKFVGCLTVCSLLLLGTVPPGWAGMPFLLAAGEGGGGGAHVDLVVRKVMFTPARAHAGDIIRVEMVWEYWGDMINNHYDTTFAEVRANGKVVAKKPFEYRFGAFLGDVYRETFLWDTKGMPPGQYRIRAEVPLRLDATPYDNYLDVKESLVLYATGAAPPAGEEIGGSGIAENPPWRKR